jgi:hypothetical protein
MLTIASTVFLRPGPFKTMNPSSFFGHAPGLFFCERPHSAFTILPSMDVPAKVVQEIAGHNTSNITLGIYNRVTPGMHESDIDLS